MPNLHLDTFIHRIMMEQQQYQQQYYNDESLDQHYNAHDASSPSSPASAFAADRFLQQALSSSSQSSAVTMDLIPVYPRQLILAVIPLLALAFLSYNWGLGLEGSILIGSVRSAIQLTVLGAILHPIFQYGPEYPAIVVAYLLAMVLLASWEATHRSKYHFDGIYRNVLCSFVVSVSVMACFAFGILLQPQPLWNPQYAIPITGMILGNCITGVSLALNSICKNLVESSAEIELLLALGAAPSQAVARLTRESVKLATTPMLNSMAVIGLISIPGMMTGQILAGSPVLQAARYQLLILYLIAMSAFGTIFCEIAICQRVAFHPKTGMLQSADLFYPKRSLYQRLFGWWEAKKQQQKLVPQQSKDDDSGEEQKLLTPDTSYQSTTTTTATSTEKKIELVTVFEAKPESDYGKNKPVLELKSIAKSFEQKRPLLESMSSSVSDSNKSTGSSNVRNNKTSQPVRRVLFQDFSCALYAGQVTVVRGPSGSGKSTLLKIMARLVPHDNDQSTVDNMKTTTSAAEMLLQQAPLKDSAPSDWRRHVRYVSQSKVDIPGTPRDLILQLPTFASWKKHLSSSSSREEVVTKLIQDTIQYMNAIGLTSDENDHEQDLAESSLGGAASFLDKEWKTLSGGESQRVFLALSLATNPTVLLMDESTSALDLGTKLLVEKLVLRKCRESNMSIVWITHDPDQMDRLMNAPSLI